MTVSGIFLNNVRYENVVIESITGFRSSRNHEVCSPKYGISGAFSNSSKLLLPRLLRISRWSAAGHSSSLVTILERTLLRTRMCSCRCIYLQEECNVSPISPARTQGTQFLYKKKERDGWYTTQAYERIETILRRKFFSLLEGHGTKSLVTC